MGWSWAALPAARGSTSGARVRGRRIASRRCSSAGATSPTTFAPRASTGSSRRSAATPTCDGRWSASSATTARRGTTVMVGRDIGTVVAAGRVAQGLPHGVDRGPRPAPRRGDGSPRPRRPSTSRRSSSRDAADSGRAVAPLRKAAGCAGPRHRRARRRRLRGSDRGGPARAAHGQLSPRPGGRMRPGSTAPARFLTRLGMWFLGPLRVEGLEHVPRRRAVHPRRQPPVATSTR